MRQRMDKVHGSNLNFLIIIEHCIYTRMNTAQWHVTDNKTFSLIHTHLCWLSDIQTQLSVTRNCIKRVVFSSKPTALKQISFTFSRGIASHDDLVALCRMKRILPCTLRDIQYAKVTHPMDAFRVFFPRQIHFLHIITTAAVQKWFLSHHCRGLLPSSEWVFGRTQ